MLFSRSNAEMSSSTSSVSLSHSLFLIPLLVGLMLQGISSTSAAPATAPAPVQHTFQSSYSRNTTHDAAKKAASLSKPAKSDANRLNTANPQKLDLTPWNEVHQIALPIPESHVMNKTIISNGTSPSSSSSSSNITNSSLTNHTSISNSSLTSSTNRVQALSTKKKTTHKKKKKKVHHKKKPKKTKKKKTKAKGTTTTSKQNSIATKTSAITQATSIPTTSNSDDCSDEITSFPSVKTANSSGSCFPALDFNMPSSVPSSLDGWWCSPTDEYAFLGFSYEISACQSQSQLISEFKDARNTFNARYVRLYGACDDANYYSKVVEAAWQAGIGIHALIWFGFDGDDKWIGRRDSLLSQLHSNPKAKFVTRGVQFGSEPLYDWVMSGTDLAKQVKSAQANLKDLQINVTVSDMAYGYQSQQDSGSQDVLDAIDFVDAHMLPYFAQDAATGDKAWHNDANDMNFFLQKTSNKKIYWSQNGWPSSHDCNAGVCPNSKNAVSNVASEKAYYDLLDSKCTTIKSYPLGGVGWFAHIYSDTQEPGYGIYDVNGKLKFDFKPRTSC